MWKGGGWVQPYWHYPASWSISDHHIFNFWPGLWYYLTFNRNMFTYKVFTLNYALTHGLSSQTASGNLLLDSFVWSLFVHVTFVLFPNVTNEELKHNWYKSSIQRCRRRLIGATAFRFALGEVYNRENSTTSTYHSTMGPRVPRLIAALSQNL
jgi:hypothetical protein